MHEIGNFVYLYFLEDKVSNTYTRVGYVLIQYWITFTYHRFSFFYHINPYSRPHAEIIERWGVFLRCDGRFRQSDGWDMYINTEK